MYGVIIPNTWRRCGLAMLAIIGVFAATIFVAAKANPAFARQAPAVLGLGVPILTAFAAAGIYGCHKMTALRVQVLEASQVGQYRLERRLGGGGMGEVYLARHRMLRRPCALKLIRADQAASANVVARFEREVQAMARLTHSNTVEIYDYGCTAEGLFYYVMEYLPGVSLEKLVKRHGPVSAGRAVYLLRQACRALREAHLSGLIHRDIKPGKVTSVEELG
jgi:serine/threonine protein kinase